MKNDEQKVLGATVQLVGALAEISDGKSRAIWTLSAIGTLVEMVPTAYRRRLEMKKQFCPLDKTELEGKFDIDEGMHVYYCFQCGNSYRLTDDGLAVFSTKQ